MYRRAVGNEAGLLSCYPFNQAQTSGACLERKSGTWIGEQYSGARLLSTTARRCQRRIIWCSRSTTRSS